MSQPAEAPLTPKEAESIIQGLAGVFFEASSKPKRAQAETTAINGLKAARQNIERMLVDLKTTRDAQVARAKTDIDAAIVAFQGSLEDVRRKFTTPSEKK